MLPNPDALASMRARAAESRAAYRATIARSGGDAGAVPDVTRGGVARPGFAPIASDVPVRVLVTTGATSATIASATQSTTLERLGFAPGTDVRLGDVVTVTPAAGAALDEPPRRFRVTGVPPFTGQLVELIAYAEPSPAGQPAPGVAP